jgi:hypothetical protein
LKEIAKLLDLSQNLVYDAFNKIRFKQTSSSLPQSEGQVGVTSTDLVIAYCLFDEKNSILIKEKILFIENISKDLKEILEK